MKTIKVKTWLRKVRTAALACLGGGSKTAAKGDETVAKAEAMQGERSAEQPDTIKALGQMAADPGVVELGPLPAPEPDVVSMMDGRPSVASSEGTLTACDDETSDEATNIGPLAGWAINIDSMSHVISGVTVCHSFHTFPVVYGDWMGYDTGAAPSPVELPQNNNNDIPYLGFDQLPPADIEELDDFGQVIGQGCSADWDNSIFSDRVAQLEARLGALIEEIQDLEEVAVNFY